MLLSAAIVDVHSVPAAAVKDEELATVAEEELTASLLEPMEELEMAMLLELFTELLLFAEDELAATELELFAELELATVLEDDDDAVVVARFGMLPEARRAVKMRMASLK